MWHQLLLQLMHGDFVLMAAVLYVWKARWCSACVQVGMHDPVLMQGSSAWV
jgi:hypothetical protein